MDKYKIFGIFLLVVLIYLKKKTDDNNIRVDQLFSKIKKIQSDLDDVNSKIIKMQTKTDFSLDTSNKKHEAGFIGKEIIQSIRKQ